MIPTPSKVGHDKCTKTLLKCTIPLTRDLGPKHSAGVVSDIHASVSDLDEETFTITVAKSTQVDHRMKQKLTY